MRAPAQAELSPGAVSQGSISQGAVPTTSPPAFASTGSDGLGQLPPGVPSSLPWASLLLIASVGIVAADSAMLGLRGAWVPSMLSAALAIGLAAAALWYQSRYRYLVEIGNRIAQLPVSGRAPQPARALMPRLLGPFPVLSDDEVGYLAARLNGMAAALSESSETIEAERSQTALILASMESGVLLTDASGTIVTVNPSGASLLGPRAVVGQSLPDLVQSDELGQFIREAALRRQAGQLAFWLPHARRHTLAVVSPLGEGPAGSVVVLQDLEEQRRLDSVRRDFIANVSHELRTPLTSIRAMAETLHDGGMEDPTVAVPFLNIILAEVERLTALTDDLLDLARYESGRLEMGRADLKVLIDDVLDQVRPNARLGGLELSVDVARLPVVRGDPAALRQVLLNLLDNAIKYTSEGKVEVVARVEPDEKRVRIAVRDTGPGIAPEHLSRVFERFYRADKARSRALGGTGLGLSIARHVVEAHGGQIAVDSQVGQGSTFTVWLPVERPFPIP